MTIQIYQKFENKARAMLAHIPDAEYRQHIVETRAGLDYDDWLEKQREALAEENEAYFFKLETA